MSCPAVVDVVTPGPPGIGLPSGVGFAGYAVVKDGSTPYLYKLIELEQVGLPQALGITASPTFVGITLSSFAAGATGIVTSNTNGQLARVAIGSGLSIVNGALVASGSSGTNLSYDAATRVLSSSTGDDVTLPLSTTLAAGLQSAADKVKLDAITVDAATKGIERVRNTTGAEIPNGAVVRIPSPGSSGTTLLVALADASDEATAANTYGLAQGAIPHNSDGIVRTFGELSGINTDHLVEGGLVYLSEVAGQTTSTRPTQPAHSVIVGWCVKKGPGTSGILAVKIANGQELDELHDVLITGNPPAAGAPKPVLARHSDGLWRNTLITPADTGAATVASTGSYNDLVDKPNLSLKADLVGGVIPTAQIPAIAISDYLGAVNSQAAMLALTGQRGDWCLRTDAGNAGQWVLSGDNASILGNWVQIPVPVVPVQSVNGQTGIIVLSAADIGAVSTSDARLENSREWSAPTATQAQAEERTSTDRLAFSPLRVGQAVAAGVAEWWALITSSLGRSLVSAATEAQARSLIGAGTSNVILSDTAPSTLAATASAGTASEASRRDHQHALPSAAQIGAASPAGNGSELQYRVAGSPATLGAVTGSSVDGSGNITLGSRFSSTINGAADAPAFRLTGSIFTGGTAASTKPLFLIEPTGATSTSFNTAGTLFALNTPSGFTGDIINVLANGTSVFSYNAANQRIQFNSGLCSGNFTANGTLATQISLSFNGQTNLGTDDNAANILLLRSANSPLASQAFRVNGTYSSSTSYERLKIAWERSSADCVFVGTITNNILTVTSVISGALAVGQIITGTSLPAGQRITAPGTGTGGPGTYTLAFNSTIATSTTFTSGQAVCRVGTEKGSGGGTARAVDLVTDDIARFRVEPDGVIRYSQPAPVAVNTTATLTTANLKAGIITTTTAAAVDMTLPTGTQVDAGFAANIDGLTHEWSVINTGANAATILAATDHTIVGSAAVAAGTSALFATRRTATNTYVTYRKS